MFEYICPVCGNSLQKSNAEYLCKNNHSYDISKQGYINLLMSSKSFHGDSKAMIMARHDFLKKGYYSHLLQKICHSVSSYAPQGGRILDMGCGEGYYTSELPSEFLSVGGIDISKDAISIAAKRKSGALFAVASASKLPVADNSVDIALSVFAPFYIDEIKRILKKSGVFM
ncbi:MAG: methyltransferase domain-containing protein, partial [Clostridia bacterium]